MFSTAYTYLSIPNEFVCVHIFSPFNFSCAGMFIWSVSWTTTNPQLPDMLAMFQTYL